MEKPATEMPEAARPAELSSAQAIVTLLSQGKSIAEVSALLQARFQGGDNLSPDEMLALGRLLREQKRWSDAAAWYANCLTLVSDATLKEKVQKELIYCARMADGWVSSKEKDSYSASINVVDKMFQITPPDEIQKILGDIVSSFPDRWEAHAMLARNFERMGKASEAESEITKAIQLGGEAAGTSTVALRKRIGQRKTLNDAGQSASKLMKAGKKKDAAALLRKTWENYPDAVEMAFKSCQIMVENRDFEDAADLSAKVSNYLAEHPDHPLAERASLLAVATEKSTEADKLRDKLGSSAPSSTPQKGSKASTSSKGSKAASGSMADKFRNRTK